MGRGSWFFLDSIMVLKGGMRRIGRCGPEGWAGKAPGGTTPSSVHDLSSVRMWSSFHQVNLPGYHQIHLCMPLFCGSFSHKAMSRVSPATDPGGADFFLMVSWFWRGRWGASTASLHSEETQHLQCGGRVSDDDGQMYMLVKRTLPFQDMKTSCAINASRLKLPSKLWVSLCWFIIFTSFTLLVHICKKVLYCYRTSK